MERPFYASVLPNWVSTNIFTFFDFTMLDKGLVRVGLK